MKSNNIFDISRKKIVYILSAAKRYLFAFDCFIGKTSDFFLFFHFGNCCDTSVKWVETCGSGTKQMPTGLLHINGFRCANVFFDDTVRLKFVEKNTIGRSTLVIQSITFTSFDCKVSEKSSHFIEKPVNFYRFWTLSLKMWGQTVNEASKNLEKKMKKKKKRNKCNIMAHVENKKTEKSLIIWPIWTTYHLRLVELSLFLR